MAKKLEMRAVQKNDFEGLSILYKEVYNINLNKDYWQWKYFDNPAGEIIYMYVPLEGERTVGEAGMIPATVIYKNKHTPASQCCDITVHPDYQKGGTFLKLARLSIDKVIDDKLFFIYGFSVPVTLKVSKRFLKFRSVCTLWRWLLVINPKPYLLRKIKVNFIAGIIAALVRPVIKARILRRCLKTDNKIIEVNRFDERFDAFWEKRKQDYEIAVARDSTYLNWRYFDNPSGTYKVFAYLSGNEIRGFIILTKAEDEIKRGFIMDILADPSDNKITEYLLSSAMEYFFEEKVDAVMTWFPKESKMVERIEAWGFIGKETIHNLIVNLTGEEDVIDSEYILNPANWYFTMGDSDYH